MNPILIDPETFTPVEHFFEFESFLWSEKFQDLSEFQIITPTLPNYFRRGTLVKATGSDSIGIVTSVTCTIGNDGKMSYDVKGESVLGIYKHRPALPEIRSTDWHSRMHPEGWEWGDVYSDLYNISPLDILMDVWRRVDRDHYKRDDLSFLKTNLSFEKTERPKKSPVEKKFNYYSVGRNSTVWDVFSDLMTYGRFGLITEHQNGEIKVKQKYINFPDSPISFSDYNGASQTFSNEDNKNVILNAVDDWVYFTKGDMDVKYDSSGRHIKGLNARVRYFESDVKDLYENQLQMHVKDKIITETIEQYLQSSALDVSVTKKENWNIGDLFRIILPWDSGTRLMIVQEVTRTQDSGGYKKFPRFVPYSHPFSSTEPESESLKSLAHFSYYRLKDNLEKKTSWT